MSGLPDHRSKMRPRDAWNVFVLGAVENLTRSLMRGDPFDEQSLTDLTLLRRRLDAFGRALDDRLELTERNEK